MKAKLNYWVDMAIAVAFGLSALSGLVFLLPAGAGTRPLGLGFPAWSRLHTWSSLALMAGVLAHLLLHARWILSMTRRICLPERTARCQAVGSPAAGFTRRQFLCRAAAVLAAGVATVGCAALLTRRTDDGAGADVPQAAAGDGVAPTPQPEPQGSVAPTPTAEPSSPAEPTVVVPTQPPAKEGPTGVACLRGVVYDPYPGRCGRYTDRDGDGICDFSIPGSGVN